MPEPSSCKAYTSDQNKLWDCRNYAGKSPVNYNNDMRGVCYNTTNEACADGVYPEKGKCSGDELKPCSIEKPPSPPPPTKCEDLVSLGLEYPQSCDINNYGSPSVNCQENPDESCKICVTYTGYKDGKFVDFKCAGGAKEGTCTNYCTWSKPPVYPSKRIINFKNNCNADVHVVTTLDDNEWLGKYDPHCKETYVTPSSSSNPINDHGTNCYYVQQYAVPTLSPKDIAPFTESLYPVPSNNWHACGMKGQYCRPGANYRAIWANTTPGNIDKAILSQAKALEITYGGGASGNLDTFDISGMIEGGCAAHTNAYENDLGASDIGTNCTESCEGGKCSETQPTPLQVSHNLKELYDVLKSDVLKSDVDPPKYKDMKKTIGLLADTPWAESQKGDVGCFTKGVFTGPRVTKESKCQPQPPASTLEGKYVCGWPWIYNTDDTTYYIKPNPTSDPDEHDKLAACTEPHIKYIDDDNSKPTLNRDCTANTSVMTQIRNELYDCSAQQAIQQSIHEGKGGIPRRQMDPSSTNHYYNEFIPVQVTVDNCVGNESNDDNNIDISCDYKDYENGKAQQANVCPAGYAFQYDDTHSTFGCDISGNHTPVYNVTFCPTSSPPPPKETCTTPSLPTSPKGTWIPEGDKAWFYNCNKGYYPSTTPSPSAICDKDDLTYIPPTPTDGFCHTCPTPTLPKEYNASWITHEGKGKDQWDYHCNPYFHAVSTPTAYCNKIGEVIISPTPTEGTCQPSKSECEIPTPTSKGGSWYSCNLDSEHCKNGADYHFHCNQKENYYKKTGEVDYYSICTDGKRKYSPNEPIPSDYCGTKVDCQGSWTDWTDTDTCSKTCGGGNKNQSRTYNISTPSAYGGKACPSYTSQTRATPCNTNECICPSPSLPTSDNGEWYKDDKTWFYKCLNNYYPSTTPSPSASCNVDGDLSYTEPIPTDGFCKKIECSPKPPSFMNGSWIKDNDNDVFYASCTPGYIGATPSPTATCGNNGIYEVPSNMNNYCCNNPSPTSIYGYYTEDDNGLYFKNWLFTCPSGTRSDETHTAHLTYNWPDIMDTCNLEYSIPKPTGGSCKKIPCSPNIPPPTYNGTWKGNEEDDTYKFVCNINYEPYDPNQPTPSARCNNMLSPPSYMYTNPPSSSYCKKIYNCVDMPSIPPHSVWEHVMPEGKYEAICSPSNDFNQQSIYTTECNTNTGKWTPNIISLPSQYCLFKCPTPNEPTNGTYSGPTVSGNEKIWTLSCNSPTYVTPSRNTYTCDTVSGDIQVPSPCKLIECPTQPPSPPIPSNGAWIRDDNNNNYYYKCNQPTYAGQSPSPIAYCTPGTGNNTYTYIHNNANYCCDISSPPTFPDNGYWIPDNKSNKWILNCNTGYSGNEQSISISKDLTNCNFSPPPSLSNKINGYCTKSTCPLPPPSIKNATWTVSGRGKECKLNLKCNDTSGRISRNNPNTYEVDETLTKWEPTPPIEYQCEWECPKRPPTVTDGVWSDNTIEGGYIYYDKHTLSCDQSFKPNNTTATCYPSIRDPTWYYTYNNNPTTPPLCEIDCDSDIPETSYGPWLRPTPTTCSNVPSMSQTKSPTGIYSTCEDKVKTQVIQLTQCRKPRHKKTDDKSSYSGRKTLDSEDYYDSPERYSLMGQEYASIHAAYSTVEDLNKLIKEFYTPDCGLYLDIPDETLMKNPDLMNTQVNPGYAHCFK